MSEDAEHDFVSPPDPDSLDYVTGYFHGWSDKQAGRAYGEGAGIPSEDEQADHFLAERDSEAGW